MCFDKQCTVWDSEEIPNKMNSSKSILGTHPRENADKEHGLGKLSKGPERSTYTVVSAVVNVNADDLSLHRFATRDLKVLGDVAIFVSRLPEGFRVPVLQAVGHGLPRRHFQLTLREYILQLKDLASRS